MKNPFKRYRVDFLLFGVFACLIVMSTVSAIWVSYTITVREVENNTSFYQKKLLTQLNKQINIQLQSIEQTSLALSYNNELLDYISFPGDPYNQYTKKSSIEALLSNIVYSNEFVQSIQLWMDRAPSSNPESIVYFGSIGDIHSESWYESVDKADFTWIGERSIPTERGPQSVISFFRKIQLNTGKSHAFIVINIKSSAFQALIGSESEGVNRILVDAGGRTVAQVGSVPLQPMVARYLDSMTGSSGDLSINKELFVVWSQFFNSGWTLIEATPWNLITAGSLKLAWTLTLLGGACFIVAVLLTLLISRQFIRPLKILLGIMKQFDINGNPTPMPNDYTNEFGALFKGYRFLLLRIDELYKSLQDQFQMQRIAEVRALQAMINPHFIYNTLDQLNWMAIRAGHDKISQTLILLAKMLRIGLSNGESVIPIKDELEYLECYLQIQQLRMGEQLTWEYKIGGEIKELYIPKLTLQPFVENAIKHGFHGFASGHIEIQAEITAEGLIFTIKDNGRGIRSNLHHQDTHKKKGGYGIRNVRERLEAFFGTTDHITITSLDDGGTSVKIKLMILDGKDSMEGWRYVEGTIG